MAAGAGRRRPTVLICWHNAETGEEFIARYREHSMMANAPIRLAVPSDQVETIRAQVEAGSFPEDFPQHTPTVPEIKTTADWRIT